MKLAKLFGDFGKLNKLSKQLGKDRVIAFLDGLSKDLGAEALTLTREGFDLSEAPSGKRWKRLKGDRKRPPLMRTGILKASFRVKSFTKKVEVYSYSFLANFHQEGTERITARPMLPKKNLSHRWTDRLERVFWLHVRKLTGGLK